MEAVLSNLGTLLLLQSLLLVNESHSSYSTYLLPLSSPNPLPFFPFSFFLLFIYFSF
jgi:hypothetical protein